MLTFLLLFCANSQQIDVILNTDKVIDSFEKYGQILDQSLEYDKDSLQPCQIKKQQLVQYQGISLDLIDTYSESSFYQNFKDGQYNGTIDEIVAAVPIENGSVVLTKSGLLQHLLIDKQISIQQSLQLTLNTSEKLFMKYLPQKSVIIILAHEQTLAIQLSKEINVLQNAHLYKIFEQFNTKLIHSVATINDMIFLAAGNQGVQMFRYKDKNIHVVSWISDDTKIELSQIANAVDVKVFQQSQAEVYFIYVLDQDIGVRQFTYNSVNTFIQQNNKLGLIPFSGNIMDIHQNIMMIIQFQKSHSTITEIHLDYANNTFQERNQYRTFKDVKDIDILNHFVIILGKSGHQVLKHSLPKTFHNISQYHLIIPNLQQLDYIEYKNTAVFYGVTKHRFFYSSFKEQPSYISCYANETIGKVKFVYKQKMTRCPEQPDREYCEIDKHYTVNFIPPSKGANYAQLLLIYGVAGVLGFGFVLLILILWNEYRKYEKCVYNEMVELPQGNETELSGSPEGKKFMKLPNKSASPHFDDA